MGDVLDIAPGQAGHGPDDRMAGPFRPLGTLGLEQPRAGAQPDADAADVILKRFEEPDEVREMPFGRFELITLGGQTIGRATYQPGWRWSEHVGPGLGLERCPVEHVGIVLSGDGDGGVRGRPGRRLRAGESSTSRPSPTTAGWSATSRTCSLPLVGAEHYATDE